MNTIRLRYKFPQTSVERHSELIANNWKQLREPHSRWLYALISLPLAYLNILIAIKLLGLTSFRLTATGPPEITSNGVYVISYNALTISTTTQNFVVEMPHLLVLIIGAILVMLFIHELLHLIFVPNFLTSNKTSVGVSYYGYVFVYSEDVISKTKYILVLLAPFLLISILLPIVLNVFDLLNPLLVLWILFNAAGSCGDLLGVIIILIQVPAGAYMTQNGVRTYWRKTNPNSI